MHPRALAFAAVPVVPLVVLAACGGGAKQATWPQPSDAGAEAAAAGDAQSTEALEPGIAAIAAKVAPDMQREGAFVRQELAPGKHARVDVTLKGDECYTIIALGQAGALGDLDMAMLYKDPTSGQLAPIAQDSQTDNSAVLGVPPTLVCPPKASDVVLDLSAKQGAGAVGIGLYAKTNPQAHPAGPPAGDAVGELLAKQGAALAKGMSPEGAPMQQALKEGETFPFTVTLTAGKCYAVVAVSPKGGVADLDMRLLMPPFFTMEVERDKRTDNVAVLGSPSPECPITLFPVPYRVDVTAKKGAGPVAVQLFSKSK